MQRLRVFVNNPSSVSVGCSRRKIGEGGVIQNKGKQKYISFSRFSEVGFLLIEVIEYYYKVFFKKDL